MRYFVRLNEDPDLQAEATHVEKISSTEILIRDVAAFPFYAGPIRVSKFELVDEEGTVWAFRRLPPAACIMLTESIKLSVNWLCTLTTDGQVMKFEAQG